MVRKRKSARKKFFDAVKSFTIVLKANPEISRLGEEFDEVSAKYKAIRDMHDEITELMTEAKVEEGDFTSHDGFIEAVMTEYGGLLAELENYRKASKIINNTVSKPTEKSTESEKERPKSNLEIIKVPQFSGNIKNYRTWKRIFKDTMKKNYEDEGNQLARLIEAIQPPLKFEIECFTTTEAIWKFLDKLLGAGCTKAVNLNGV